MYVCMLYFSSGRKAAIAVEHVVVQFNPAAPTGQPSTFGESNTRILAVSGPWCPRTPASLRAASCYSSLERRCALWLPLFVKSLMSVHVASMSASTLRLSTSSSEGGSETCGRSYYFGGFCGRIFWNSSDRYGDVTTAVFLQYFVHGITRQIPLPASATKSLSAGSSPMASRMHPGCHP